MVFFQAPGIFFESGHGKGEADGIGGAVKRKADNFVAHGKDILNAQELYNLLLQEESKINFFFVNQQDVNKYSKKIPKNLKTLSGTQKIHQLTVRDRNSFLHRTVSCFCEENKWLRKEFCMCNDRFQLYKF